MNTNCAFFLIVVPAYNTAERVDRAIQSVLQQTFTDFRLVLVDDRSTDNTLSIMKEYEKTDGRIHVIEMPKRSYAGTCRNAAIETMNGEKYVVFLDSDDNFFTTTALQDIYEEIARSNFPDVVTIGFSREVKYGKIFDKRRFSSVKEILDANAVQPWRKVVKSDIVGRFVENRFAFNDVVWTLRVLDCVKTVSSVENILYEHRSDNPISVQNGETPEIEKLRTKSIKLLVEDLESEMFNTNCCSLKKEEYIKKYTSPKFFLGYFLSDYDRNNVTNNYSTKNRNKITNRINLNFLKSGIYALKIIREKILSLFRNKKFFKIIIPNYNNKIYINKCLDSVLNQTFNDYVCIIVDDMSTDGSDKIAMSYSERYPDRFVFVKMKKKGYAGAARNIGIDYPIRAEYIKFMDSDDWLYDNDVLKNLHDKLVNSGFPKCLFHGSYWNKDKKDKLIKNFSIYSDFGSPWQVCLKYKYFKDVKFAENRPKCNDNVWFIKVMNKIDLENKNSLVIYDKPCYVYNQLSITSCQNGQDRKSLKNIYSHTVLLYFDLQKTPALTDFSKKYKEERLNKVSHFCKTELNYESIPIQIDVTELMKNSFATSVDQRRYERMELIFPKNGLLIPKKEIGVQLQYLNGAQNCCRTHLNIVKKAKELDLPFVMVFEDDAYPCKNCSEIFQDYLNLVPSDAELLVFGWIRHVNLDKNHKTTQVFKFPYNRIHREDTQIFGAHAYVLFKKSYDKYIEYSSKNELNEQPDGMTYNIFEHGYVTNIPLFIQYNDTKKGLIHEKNHGYFFYGAKETPPDGFLPYEYYKNT